MQKMIIRISAVVSLFLLILGSPRCFAQSEAGFIESAGVRLRFFDSGGDKETVILLTLGGDNSGGRASRLIRAGFRVVTLHMRGFGDSEKPSGAAMYGLEMSNDVLRLIEHLSLPRVHLIGNSIGARIANRFRAAHPNRLLSLTMLQGGVMTKSSAYLSRASEFADALDRGDWGPFILGTTARGRKAPTREEIEALNEKQKSSGATRVWAAVIRG